MSHILCIDTRYLKEDPRTVQRDVNFEKLLNVPCLQLCEAGNIPPFYVPLTIAISVRSCYDNSVLVMNRAGKERFYYAVSNYGEMFPHRGTDLNAYLSSLAFLDFINYNNAVGDIMQHHSDCVPIGVYNPDAKSLRPIFYSQIVLSDWGMYLLRQHYLKDDVHLESIESLKGKYEDGSLSRPILDTFLIISKEEDPNGK